MKQHKAYYSDAKLIYDKKIIKIRISPILPVYRLTVQHVHFQYRHGPNTTYYEYTRYLTTACIYTVSCIRQH